MSGAQTSSFGPPNQLFEAASGAPLIANQNALLTGQQQQQALQKGQQEMGLTDMQVTAQGAAALLGMDEPAAATAYPIIKASLNAQGFGKNLPEQYPGHAAAQAFVSRAMPILDQYKAGFLGGSLPPLTGTPGQQGAAAGAADGLLPGENKDQFLARVVQRESGGRNVRTEILNPDGTPASTASGPYQMLDGTFAGAARKAGIDITNPATGQPYKSAMEAPRELQDRVASALYDQEGTTPWNASDPVRKQASAAPGAPVGTAARTGGVNVAGPGAGPAGGATVPVGDLGLVRYPDGSVGTPQAGQPAPVQQAQATPQQQQAQPATGLNAPQFKQAQALRLEAQQIRESPGFALSQPKQARVEYLNKLADSMQTLDSVVRGPGNIGIHTLTGQQDSAPAPNAQYEWDAQRGAYIDRSGTHPPVTPNSPRMSYVEGVGLVQSKAGGGADVVIPMSPAGIAMQSAAKAQGTGLGTEVAKQVPALMNQGRSSAQAIGNIDYGMNQLREATKGGIPSGYFSGALANAAAAAKSLGIDTAALGVDPKAVGNIQSAQKTLAVVSGAILQQVLGGNSDITDAKLQHFIHAQPGIETDPQAVERVLNWARSQFVYEREMSAAGVKEAAKPENGGMLPTGWQADYFDKHGFAPIYNPGTGEMQQPEGAAPSREPPASITAAPVNPAARKAGETYTTPKGPLIWSGTGWLPPKK